MLDEAETLLSEALGRLAPMTVSVRMLHQDLLLRHGLFEKLSQVRTSPWLHRTRLIDQLTQTRTRSHVRAEHRVVRSLGCALQFLLDRCRRRASDVC